ncbi:hypothetical protein LTR94_030726, partial [Friedmanniomyces endolithicus]
MRAARERDRFVRIARGIADGRGRGGRGDAQHAMVVERGEGGVHAVRITPVRQRLPPSRRAAPALGCPAMTQPPAASRDYMAFTARGGDMGRRIAAYDWASSPLGPVEDWPAVLRHTLAVILPAQAEIVLFWGAEQVALYNDAYAPTIGNKHPHAL